MARITVDIELLMVGLLDQALPGVTVLAETDVDAVDPLPMVIVRPVTGAMISNGGPGLGWSWLVALSILQKGHQEASDLADRVYGIVHGFEDQQAVMAGVGCVTHVEDNSMPTRTATSVTADNLTQYDGAWQLTVTPVTTEI